MPRIRIRTPEGERIVGTPNCSTLTIRLDALAQRQTLQLRADAQLIGGNAVIEHWTWDFHELADNATIQLISDPASDPAARYDPPDTSRARRTPIIPEVKVQSQHEIEAVERELKAISTALNALAGAKRATIPKGPCCSFCGKDQEDVRKLIAGPAVFICDECIHIASDLISD